MVLGLDLSVALVGPSTLIVQPQTILAVWLCAAAFDFSSATGILLGSNHSGSASIEQRGLPKQACVRYPMLVLFYAFPLPRNGSRVRHNHAVEAIRYPSKMRMKAKSSSISSQVCVTRTSRCTLLFKRSEIEAAKRPTYRFDHVTSPSCTTPCHTFQYLILT